MRSAFSQAIHRSIQRTLRKYEETGEIGKQKVVSKTQAVELAAQAAYKRVRTALVAGDTGPRNGTKS